MGTSQPETGLERLLVVDTGLPAQLQGEHGLCLGHCHSDPVSVPQGGPLGCLPFPSPHLLSQPLDGRWSAVARH